MGGLNESGVNEVILESVEMGLNVAAHLRRGIEMTSNYPECLFRFP